jgi:hypothetical protein
VSVEPPVFTVLDSGTSIDDQGTEMPTIVIDAADHPEVADLARVHAIDGIGDIATEGTLVEAGADAKAAGIHQVLVLAVQISVPVRCVFAVAIPLPQHRQVVDQAIVSKGLVIATTAPDRAALDRPLWLAIDLDPTHLASLLPPSPSGLS